MKRSRNLILILLGCCIVCGAIAMAQEKQSLMPKGSNPYYSHTDTKKLHVSNAEWEKILAPAVYSIAREQGTERAFTGPYWNNHTAGTYYCRVCGYPLFSADTKFESGTGWPSFFRPLTKQSVETVNDNSFGMARTEVRCARCGSHLGHVFDDGPPPTHLRYCMNGTVLDFVANK